MRDYKGWTAKERIASFKKTKAAIAAGIIPPPTKCNRCGKATGRIDYHNHDYSDPIKYLEQLCQGCHTRLHRIENKQAAMNAEETSKTSLSSKNKPEVPKKQPETDSKARSGKADDEILNSWLEQGMCLPPNDLKAYLCNLPVELEAHTAFRGLGIIYSGGYTKQFNCAGFPQTRAEAWPKDRVRFELVLDKIKEYENNGVVLLINGIHLSEKLISNFDNNP